MVRSLAIANKYRDKLMDYYGKERGAATQYAEAFVICQYGSQPSAKEIRRLFPFYE